MYPNRERLRNAAIFVTKGLTEFECARGRTIRADHPQGATQAIRPLCLGASERKPFLVDHVRFFCIDIDITVGIFMVSRLDGHLLMPTVHAADRVWMYGEGQILMNSTLAPEDACGVGIIACKWLNAL